MWGGEGSETPLTSDAAGKGEIPAYRTQSHRWSRHVIGTDPDTGWLTMNGYPKSKEAAGAAFEQMLEGGHHAIDVRRGLLYLPDRIVPVVQTEGVWALDATRSPVVDLGCGLVPVVPLGGA